MIKKLLILILLFTFQEHIWAQTNPPKREFRAAWIATVVNLDWPASPNESTDKKISSLIELLDGLKAAGINAVMFQVRTESDAFYNSSYEPWSYWLTGSQGRAPSPYFDPLEFAIEEAHKRNMELHAWFNPYRVERSVGSYPLAENHVAVLHPEWVIQKGTIKILNPGLPQVRQYVTDVIMDVVNRYDVDGVHFDDYFYPYPPNQFTNSDDDSTFNQYPNGFTNRGDWRRNNINLLVKMVHDSIYAAKPWVKFGISPFGIWRPNNPSGISGMDAYNTIYCDALAWIDQQTVDYLTPQLYWPRGGSQDYGKLMPWWADKVSGNMHYYPGHGLYRAETWGSDEVPAQLRLNRNQPGVDGSVFFRARNITNNTAAFADSLKREFYRYPSLKPLMAWKDNVPPNQPASISFGRINDKPVAGFKWETPPEASDGETAWEYVVYNFSSDVGPVDFEDAANIKAIVKNNNYIPLSGGSFNGKYFAVTALDRINNESSPTNIISVPAPVSPGLIAPFNGEEDLSDSVYFTWNYAENASSYHLQIAEDAGFTSLVLDYNNLTDTTFLFTSLQGMKTYYWRVRTSNPAGTSNFSDVFSFTTGFPYAPAMVYPLDQTTNVPLDLTIVWEKVEGAEYYNLQLNKSSLFTSTSSVVDTVGIVDTFYVTPKLEPNKIYFLRISAANDIGTSEWTKVVRFKTTSSTDVTEEEQLPENFSLSQNYPNPFNPSTIIEFTVPKQNNINSQHVTLVVYDILGRKIKTLVNGPKAPGHYKVVFSANSSERLSSGIYFYVLTAGQYREAKKMILNK